MTISQLLQNHCCTPYRLRKEKDKLAAQRAKLLDLKQDQRLREIKLFEDSRRSFMTRQQRIHEAELQRLEEETRSTQHQRQLERKNLEAELRGGPAQVWSEGACQRSSTTVVPCSASGAGGLSAAGAAPRS